MEPRENVAEVFLTAGLWVLFSVLTSFKLLPTPKKIKKTKRGPALSANSVYTKVGTFLLHKRVQ